MHHIQKNLYQKLEINVLSLKTIAKEMYCINKKIFTFQKTPVLQLFKKKKKFCEQRSEFDKKKKERGFPGYRQLFAIIKNH